MLKRLEHEYAFGYSLRMIVHRIKQYLDEQLEPFDITNQQARIAVYIHASEEKEQVLRQRDLEQVTGLKGSSITSLLQGLEKRGYVVRTSGDTDARVKQLHLTPKGRELYHAFDSILKEAETKFFDGIPQTQQDVFLDTMRAILFNLDRHGLHT